MWNKNALQANSPVKTAKASTTRTFMVVVGSGNRKGKRLGRQRCPAITLKMRTFQVGQVAPLPTLSFLSAFLELHSIVLTLPWIHTLYRGPNSDDPKVQVRVPRCHFTLLDLTSSSPSCTHTTEVTAVELCVPRT